MLHEAELATGELVQVFSDIWLHQDLAASGCKFRLLCDFLALAPVLRGPCLKCAEGADWGVCKTGQERRLGKQRWE